MEIQPRFCTCDLLIDRIRCHHRTTGYLMLPLAGFRTGFTGYVDNILSSPSYRTRAVDPVGFDPDPTSFCIWNRPKHPDPAGIGVVSGSGRHWGCIWIRPALGLYLDLCLIPFLDHAAGILLHMSSLRSTALCIEHLLPYGC